MFDKKIYHGCYTDNKDGTRILIDFKNGEQYLLPKDCTNIGVQARNTVKKNRKCSLATIKIYLDNLQTFKQ